MSLGRVVLVFVGVAVMLANAMINLADVECGKVPRQGKVVGGTDASQGEFPWLVSLTRRGGHFCGGTLISKRHVLTAAHCVCSGLGQDFLLPASIRVTIGQHDLRRQPNSEAYELPVRRIIVHHDYRCNKAKSDIAILELDGQVQWSWNVLPACLPDSTAPSSRSVRFENVVATVAGWGWTSEDSAAGGRANVLQKAKVNVLENEKCRQWYKSQGKKTKIQESQMCAGHEQGGVDACWADSGGPLMADTQSHVMVIGVVSTGIGCARPYLPGIYTRISEFIPWIETNMK